MDSSLNMDLWQKTWEKKLAAHVALEDDIYNGIPAQDLSLLFLRNFPTLEPYRIKIIAS